MEGKGVIEKAESERTEKQRRTNLEEKVTIVELNKKDSKDNVTEAQKNRIV